MVGLMLLIFDLSCCFSGAYGTSTFLLSGSGVDGRFPNMPFSAFPPYPLVTSRRYHFWGQTAVQRAIPLRGDLKIHSVLTLTEGLQRVFFFHSGIHIAEIDS